MELQVSDPPSNFGLQRYDYCVVFPIDRLTNELSPIAHHVLLKLVNVFGVKYFYSFYSRDYSRLYVLIRGKIKLMKSFAEVERFEMLLNDEMCEKFARRGDSSMGVDSFAIEHVPSITPLSPYQYIYAPYTRDSTVQDLFKPSSQFAESRVFSRLNDMDQLQANERNQHPFDKNVRVSLMTNLLINTEIHVHDESYSDNIVNLRYLQKLGVVSEFYPLHEDRQRFQLSREWLSFCMLPWNQPLNAVRDYFGEKVALYFAFMGYLSLTMLLPAIVGALFQILYILVPTARQPIVPSVVFCVWVVFAQHYWHRKQRFHELKWNSACKVQVHRNNENRVEFYGYKINSYVTNAEILHFNKYYKCLLLLLTSLLLLVFPALQFAALAAIYYGRYLLRDSLVGYWTQWIASGLTFVQISLFDLLLYDYAKRLTDFENHRSDAQFHNFLAVKVFLLKFVNYFASFYLLAFVAPHVPDYLRTDRTAQNCGYSHCYNVVEMNIVVVFVLEVAVRFTLKYLAPYCGWLCTALPDDDYTQELQEQKQLFSQTLDSYYDNDVMQDARDASFSDGDELEDTVARTPKRTAPRSRSKHSSGTRSPTTKRRSADKPPLTPNFSNNIQNYNPNPHASVDFSTFSPSKPHIFRPKQLVVNYTAADRHVNTLHSPSREALSPEFEEETTLASLDGDANPQQPHTAANYNLASGQQLTSTRPKMQFPLENVYYRTYDDTFESIQDYSRLFVYLALVCCFGVVTPGVVILVLVAINVEVKGKGWSLVNIFRRVTPITVSDFGVWSQIFDLVVVVGILTTAALLVFTMDRYSDETLAFKLGILAAFVFAMFCIKYVLTLAVPEMPEEVLIQQQRSQFINKKLIRKETDTVDTFHFDIL